MVLITELYNIVVPHSFTASAGNNIFVQLLERNLPKLIALIQQRLNSGIIWYVVFCETCKKKACWLIIRLDETKAKKRVRLIISFRISAANLSIKTSIICA
jgi:hypothetical protein